MAIEYHLDATTVLAETAALDYFAETLGCMNRYSDHRAGRDELQVTVSTNTAEEDPEMATLLGGVDAVLSVTFRQAKNLGDLGDAHTVRDMLNAVVRFFEDFPDVRGVFAFNFETIMVQRLSEEGIVLDQALLEPDGDNRHHTLDDLLAKYPVRAIDQALL